MVTLACANATAITCQAVNQADCAVQSKQHNAEQDFAAVFELHDTGMRQACSKRQHYAMVFSLAWHS